MKESNWPRYNFRERSQPCHQLYPGRVTNHPLLGQTPIIVGPLSRIALLQLPHRSRIELSQRRNVRPTTVIRGKHGRRVESQWDMQGLCVRMRTSEKECRSLTRTHRFHVCGWNESTLVIPFHFHFPPTYGLSAILQAELSETHSSSVFSTSRSN
jgi:hypothetical protein